MTKELAEYVIRLVEGMAIEWTITKNLIDPSDGSYGTARTSEVSELMIHKFRIYDDDGELYLEGVASNQSYENAFEPLDWAMSMYGATEIKYKSLKTGKWETL